MRVGIGVAFAALLAAWGLVVDRSQPLAQAPLFLGLQVASLGGALLGAWATLARLEGARRLGWLAVLLVAWRLAYFPIMVFSGHVASIGEWVILALGLPVVVYPVFLLTVGALHGGAAFAAGLALRPPPRLGRLVPAAVLPAFLVATLVSLSTAEDLRLLPDRSFRLEGPVPPPVEAEANPYLPALTAPGYLPTQRVILLAAGLTYETIPPSPWGTRVKAILEGLFDAKPKASTADRVVEHYLAYHAAHRFIGCRDLAECPIEAAGDGPGG